MRKSVHCINLDPAAEPFRYNCEIDIRDLISLDDVMEEMELGPNGGLIYAMEYIIDNSDWLTDQLDEFPDDEYFLIDCPGQIELYSHVPVMRKFVDTLKMLDFAVAAVCWTHWAVLLNSSRRICRQVCIPGTERSMRRWRLYWRTSHWSASRCLIRPTRNRSRSCS